MLWREEECKSEYMRVNEREMGVTAQQVDEFLKKKKKCGKPFKAVEDIEYFLSYLIWKGKVQMSDE